MTPRMRSCGPAPRHWPAPIWAISIRCRCLASRLPPPEPPFPQPVMRPPAAAGRRFAGGSRPPAKAHGHDGSRIGPRHGRPVAGRPDVRRRRRRPGRRLGTGVATSRPRRRLAARRSLRRVRRPRAGVPARPFLRDAAPAGRHDRSRRAAVQCRRGPLRPDPARHVRRIGQLGRSPGRDARRRPGHRPQHRRAGVRSQPHSRLHPREPDFAVSGRRPGPIRRPAVHLPDHRRQSRAEEPRPQPPGRAGAREGREEEDLLRVARSGPDPRWHRAEADGFRGLRRTGQRGRRLVARQPVVVGPRQASQRGRAGRPADPRPHREDRPRNRPHRPFLSRDHDREPLDRRPPASIRTTPSSAARSRG